MRYLGEPVHHQTSPVLPCGWKETLLAVGTVLALSTSAEQGRDSLEAAELAHLSGPGPTADLRDTCKKDE